jgi:alpha-beta hydrolase superfamily lysophospholipase
MQHSGPYVLAGHSFGGLYVLTFAANYPTPSCRRSAGGLDSASIAAGPAAQGPGPTTPGRISALPPALAHLGASGGRSPDDAPVMRDRTDRSTLHTQCRSLYSSSYVSA